MSRNLYYIWTNGKESQIFLSWTALAAHMKENGGTYSEEFTSNNNYGRGATKAVRPRVVIR